MPDQAFRDRYAGRRKAQGLALDQDPTELDAVKQSLENQAAGCAAGSAGAGSRTSSKDLDFSSFIIGEGVLTARLVRIVK